MKNEGHVKQPFGHVYLVEFDDKCLKIGWSSNPEARLNYLSRMSGREIARQWVSPRILNAVNVEQEVHKIFEGRRGIGEYFSVDFDEGVATVSPLCSQLVTDADVAAFFETVAIKENRAGDAVSAMCEGFYLASVGEHCEGQEETPASTFPSALIANQTALSLLQCRLSMGDLLGVPLHLAQANAVDYVCGETGVDLSSLFTLAQPPDVVKEFVEYATSQGSKSAKMYYINITKGTYAALFVLEHGGKWEGIRDCLSRLQLTTLSSAEQIALKALREAMEMDMHYKDAYKYAIGKVKGFAELIGVTKIPDEPSLKLVKPCP